MRQCPGLCTRPPIPAQLIEGHVLSHLDAFVGQDLGSWIGARLAMRTDEQVSRCHASDLATRRTVEEEQPMPGAATAVASNATRCEAAVGANSVLTLEARCRLVDALTMKPKTIAAMTAVAALAASLLATPSSVFAQEGAVFRTPGEAAYCNDYSGELICWTPNDGFTVHMTVRGRAHKSYRTDHRGYVDNRAPVLRFGQTTRLGSFVCTSRSTGLDCTNRRGHGWHLGRYVGYRLY